METQKNNGMCRCCASEGTFKDVKSSYQWMGEEEVYADMLRECLDISLCADVTGEVEGGICEVCITQLRNASNFKKQVLHTEEQFKQRLEDKFFKNEIVKVEMAPEGDEDSDNDNNDSAGDDPDYSGTEFEVPVKMECEESKPKKRGKALKASTSRAKKLKKEAGETSKRTKDQRIPRKSPTNVTTRSKVNTVTSLRDKAVKSEVKSKRKSRANDKWFKITLPSRTKDQRRVNLGTPVIMWTSAENEDKEEYDKHHDNIREVLLCSNATPIKSGGLSYNCCFCVEQYSNPRDLRKHNLDVHGENERSKFMQDVSKYNFLPKLDITYLVCILCGESIHQLDDLLKHLKYEHNRMIHLDIKNQIMPFKYPDEKHRCAICQEVFISFKRLQMHMHSHYRNYICDCSAGFMNIQSFNSHKKTHEEALTVYKIKCSLCPKSFPTKNRLTNHMKQIHTKKKHFCSFCNESFDNYKSRFDHLSEVHGVKKMELTCQICNRSFKTSSGHNMHFRRNHLLERTRPCPLCDMKFFDGKGVKNHMLTHTGSKDFECDVCNKRFGRKSSLIAHMRIHLDDRRFECTFCDLKFVQKCSLKGHLRSKHGAFLIE